MSYIFMSFISIIISVFVVFVIFFLPMLLNFLPMKNFNQAFECGVESHMSSWYGQSIPFFKVGVIFIIFELEVVFLFQLILLFSLNLNWLMISFCFLIYILLTFMFELYSKGIDWGL